MRCYRREKTRNLAPATSRSLCAILWYDARSRASGVILQPATLVPVRTESFRATLIAAKKKCHQTRRAKRHARAQARGRVEVMYSKRHAGVQKDGLRELSEKSPETEASCDKSRNWTRAILCTLEIETRDVSPALRTERHNGILSGRYNITKVKCCRAL